MALQAHRFINSRKRWLVMGLVILASLYLLAFAPVRTFIDQRQQMARAEERYELIAAENRKLEERSAELQTDAEIARIAREQYELVPPGAQAYAVMPPSPADAQAASRAAAAEADQDRSNWSKLIDWVSFWN